MAGTEFINGYELNIPGRAAPWGTTENQALKDFAGYLPTKGHYLTTQHLHSTIYSPSDDSSSGTPMIDTPNGTSIRQYINGLEGLRLETNASSFYQYMKLITGGNSGLYVGTIANPTEASFIYTNNGAGNIGQWILSSGGNALTSIPMITVKYSGGIPRVLISESGGTADSLLHVQHHSAGAVAAPSSNGITIEANVANPPALCFLTENGGESDIYFGRLADNDAGRIHYIHPGTGSMDFYVEAKRQLRIREAGLVIDPNGTLAAPDSLVHIANGDSTLAAIADTVLTLERDANNCFVSFLTAGSKYEGFYFGNDHAGAGDTAGGNNAGHLKFYTEDSFHKDFLIGFSGADIFHINSHPFAEFVTSGTAHVGAPEAFLTLYQDNNAYALPVLLIKQDDQDQAFMDFEGTTAADKTKNLSTQGANNAAPHGPDPAVWTHVGMIKCYIHGVGAAWIPYYT